MTSVLISVCSVLVVALVYCVLGMLYLRKQIKRLYDREVDKAITPVAATTEGLSEDEAKAIDPNNPPYYSRYRIDGYDRTLAPKCSCHSRTIDPGEQILIWPIPGHPDGGVDVFCKMTYQEAAGQ